MKDIKLLTDKEVFNLEKMIPRYQLLFSDYSPMMAYDQGFQIDENCELKQKLFYIAWRLYFTIQLNLLDLMNEFKVDKTIENISEIVKNCKNHLMQDCYNRLDLKNGEIRRLENCWYEEKEWYQNRKKYYND